MTRKNANTDLAYESFSADEEKDLENGIRTNLLNFDEVEIIKTEILNSRGEELSGRKIGSYFTLLVGNVHKYTKCEQERISKIIALALLESFKCINLSKCEPKVLIVGLGNRDILSDALGDLVLKNIDPTNHLRSTNPSLFSEFGYDATLLFCPTLNQGGIFASDNIKGLLKIFDFDLVIAIDSLLTKTTERLLTTVQITNTGILPGSANGKKRGEISFNSLGVPVIAIGAPTVISQNAISATCENEDIFFAPSDIDAKIIDLAKVIANGITLFLKKAK